MTHSQQHAGDYELQHLILHSTPPVEDLAPSNNRMEQTSANTSSSPRSSSDDDNKFHSRGTPGWTPFFLRKTTLIGFVICYLCLLVAIIILAIVDAKKDGIATARTTQHYLWTYGPTAVLAIVAALWGQVEHRTKQAMPWALLQKKPTPASATLLLDYITPSVPEALFRSIRSSHWPVAVAIVSSLLIKLLTVASTGLLVLQNTPIVRHGCRLAAADDFVSSFNSTAIGCTPVLSTLAIQNGSLPYLPGTSRDMAFQTLNLSQSLQGASDVQLESSVRAFRAELECEAATIRSHDTFCSDSHCHGIDILVDIDSPSCQVRNLTYGQGCGAMEGPTECDFGDVFPVQCNSTTDNETNRLVFMMGRLAQNLSAGAFNSTILSNETTIILCEPKYNISNTVVRVDSNGNLRSNASGMATYGSASSSFTGWDLVEGLHTSSEAAGLILGNAYAYNSFASKPWYEMWILFETWTNMTYPTSDLTDLETLKTAASELFTMVSAQMAKQNLMEPSNNETTGTCYATEQRLRVRGLSLYLMGAALMVLILFTVLLLSIAPRNITSRDPATIGSLALILAKSPSLLDRLVDDGSSGLHRISSHLQGVQCQSLVTGQEQNARFSIQLSSGATSPNPGPEQLSTKIQWWRPLSLLPAFKLFVITFLLLLVVVLELLYWKSEKNDGLAQVDAQGYVRFAWVYVPAMVMLAAQTLVGTIAFSSIFIFPYYVLRTKSSNTRNDMLRDYVSQTAIQSMWKSTTNRHLPVFFMALAMLLTPLLTIAVSGLYTAQPTDTQRPVPLTTVNQFNSTFKAGELDDSDPLAQASLHIGLLLTQNYTFPPWTYNELAFPEAQLQGLLANSTVVERSNVSTSLTAIRADLNCTTVPGNPTNFSAMIWNRENFTGFTDVGCDMSEIWPRTGSDAFGFFELADSDMGALNGDVFCGAYGTNETNWRAFLCGYTTNQLDVNVTLDAQSLAVLHATPDESTSRTFSNETLASPLLTTYPSSLIPSIFGSANFAGPTSSFYDPAFQAVIYESGITVDPNTFPMADYMDDAGFQRLATSLTHVYRTVVAQTASLAIRVPFDSSMPLAPPVTVGGTLVNTNIYRLRQSGVSTRILDGLLVAVALCIAASFWLMDTRRVLPKNPAPIAAGASLLAGRPEMLAPGVVQDEAQWWEDRELERMGVWEGCVFSLGWWGGEERRRFGVDIGKAE